MCGGVVCEVFYALGTFCSLSPSFECASFLDCGRFCVVNKISPAIFFFFGHSIDSYGRIKLTHEGNFCYFFKLFLLHPHKIIE